MEMDVKYKSHNNKINLTKCVFKFYTLYRPKFPDDITHTDIYI